MVNPMHDEILFLRFRQQYFRQPISRVHEISAGSGDQLVSLRILSSRTVAVTSRKITPLTTDRTRPSIMGAATARSRKCGADSRNGARHEKHLQQPSDATN
jgi:hypothetical protein